MTFLQGFAQAWINLFHNAGITWYGLGFFTAFVIILVIGLFLVGCIFRLLSGD